MKRFCVRALPAGEMNATAQHLAGCETCQKQFTVMLRSGRCSAPLKFTLAPEFLFRHEHVDYEQLVRLADNAFDATEREIIDIHLKVCASCKEDVRYFLAFREGMEQEMRISVARAEQRQRDAFSPSHWWHSLEWEPIYVAAILLMGGALLGAALFLKQRPDSLQTQSAHTPQQNAIPPAQTKSPANQTAKDNSLLPVPVPPHELPRPVSSPALSVKNRAPISAEIGSSLVTLKDAKGSVAVDTKGNVSGLDDVPTQTRRLVADALTGGTIDRPEILRGLSETNTTLRGNYSGQPFKVLFPTRKVIMTDRPPFEWEKLSGATGYRVYVANARGHEVVRSQQLSSAHTTWTPPSPLKRGEIYSWAVAALVDGREIFSPGSSVPEVKFYILSANSAHTLELLTKTRSHVALGVFYSREGMVAEAEQEFQILIKKNPTSKTAEKLLKEIQSWHRP